VNTRHPNMLCECELSAVECQAIVLSHTNLVVKQHLPTILSTPNYSELRPSLVPKCGMACGLPIKNHLQVYLQNPPPTSTSASSSLPSYKAVAQRRSSQIRSANVKYSSSQGLEHRCFSAAYMVLSHPFTALGPRQSLINIQAL
jgi:hypothetical protein